MEITRTYLEAIFNVAGKHFAEKVSELEIQIMRHQHFVNVELDDVNFQKKTRSQRLAEISASLEQYRELVVICREGKANTLNMKDKKFIMIAIALFGIQS